MDVARTMSDGSLSVFHTGIDTSMRVLGNENYKSLLG